MDLYLKAVKKDLCDLKLVERCSTTISKKWPTFVNLAIAQGPQNWDDYVNESNYLYATKCYTNKEITGFLGWVANQKYADTGKIAKNVAYWSTCEKNKENYGTEITMDPERNIRMLVFLDDHVKMSVMLRNLKSIGCFELSKLLIKALDYRASVCTSKIVEAIVAEGSVEPLCSDIWQYLLSYNDHGVVLALKEHLEITPAVPDQLDNEIYDNFPEIKKLLLGSIQDAMEVLETPSCELPNFEYFLAVATRSAEEPEFIPCMNEYMVKNAFLDDPMFNASMSSSILLSRRSPAKTAGLIKNLHDKGVLFTGKHGIDITGITHQSWSVLMNLGEEFIDYSKSVCLSYPCIDYINPNYIEFTKSLFKAKCPLMSGDCLVKLFTNLGSSLTLWAKKNDLLNTLVVVEKDAINAAKCGNVVILALILDQLEKEGHPMTKESFDNTKVHVESCPLLACWFKATEEQKEDFYTLEFGEYFYDTSVIMNNNLFFYDGKYPAVYLNEADKLFLDEEVVLEAIRGEKEAAGIN